MEDPEGDGVVTNVCKGPDPRHGEEIDGNGEEDDVGPHQDKDVEEPEPAAVHVVGVGVFVPVASSHHHGHRTKIQEKTTENKKQKSSLSLCQSIAFNCHYSLIVCTNDNCLLGMFHGR